jgi:hypothetical protein
MGESPSQTVPTRTVSERYIHRFTSSLGIRFFSRNPRTYQELFNYRHSSARTTIERAFGVVKRRYPVSSSQLSRC